MLYIEHQGRKTLVDSSRLRMLLAAGANITVDWSWARGYRRSFKHIILPPYSGGCDESSISWYEKTPESEQIK